MFCDSLWLKPIRQNTKLRSLTFAEQFAMSRVLPDSFQRALPVLSGLILFMTQKVGTDNATPILQMNKLRGRKRSNLPEPSGCERQSQASQPLSHPVGLHSQLNTLFSSALCLRCSTHKNKTSIHPNGEFLHSEFMEFQKLKVYQDKLHNSQ